MKWHLPDLPLLIHHLPREVAGLQSRENKELVKAGIAQLTPREATAAARHKIILPGEETPPDLIAIQKDISPALSRSEENLGLLLHDYVHALPEYVANGKDAEALLEHWRSLLTEHPQRLAETHTSPWSSEHAHHFWQERLQHHDPEKLRHQLTSQDWQLMAGAASVDKSELGQLKVQQWRDLIIRNRMHALTKYLYLREL